MDTQKCAHYLRYHESFLRGALGYLNTVVKHNSPVANLGNMGNVVFDHKDGFTLTP
jgi:hypothetical protein